MARLVRAVDAAASHEASNVNMDVPEFVQCRPRLLTRKLGQVVSFVNEIAMSNQSPPSHLTSHLGYWLRHVSNHVSQAFARKVEQQGVTVANGS